MKNRVSKYLCICSVILLLLFQNIAVFAAENEEEPLDNSQFVEETSQDILETTESDLQEIKEGWESVDNKTYYYVKGEKVYGEKKINNKWYYFDKKTGEMQTGFVQLPGKTVFYKETGEMVYGAQKIGNVQYMFDKVTGKLHEGWSVSDYGKVYVLKEGGIAKGEKKIGKHWYCFDEQNGVMIPDGMIYPTKEYTTYQMVKWHMEK